MANKPELDPNEQSKNPAKRISERLFNRGQDDDFSDLSGDKSGVGDYSDISNGSGTNRSYKDLSNSTERLRDDMLASEARREGLYRSNRNKKPSENEKVNQAASSAKPGVGSKLKSGANRLMKGSGKGSGKKKAAAALIGTGSVFILALGGIMLFMMIAGFGVKQQAEVLKLANYARLHLAPMRRNAQLFTEKSINPDADGYKINTQGRKLHERFAKYDPNKVLANMRQSDDLGFVTQSGERRSWKKAGRKVPFEDLEGIQIGSKGGEWVPVPERMRLSPLANYRSEKQFVKNLQSAIDTSDLFKGRSQYFRTRTADAILNASDIKLHRFIKGSRKIKTFKDAVVSAYERIKGGKGTSIKAKVPEVQEVADGKKEAFIKNLDDGYSVSQADAIATDTLTKKAVSNPAKKLSMGLSLGVMMTTLYCSADTYIDGQAEAAQARLDGNKRSAYLSQSASHQIEAGDMSSKEVMLEAKRVNGFHRSRAYQEDVGNPQSANMPHELGSESGVVPDTTSGLYKFFKVTKDLGDTISITPPGLPTATLGNVPDTLVDGGCQVLLSTGGSIATAIIENIVGAVLASGSGGTTAVAQTASKGALRTGVSTAVRRIATREVLTRAGKGIAADGFIFLLTDALIKTILPDSGNTATDDTDVAYAKNKLGAKTIANDMAYAGGGRDLSGAEVAQLDAIVKEQRLAKLHKIPLLKRLAYTGDPTTPTSQAIATLPFSPSNLKQQSTQLAFKSLNPLSTVAEKTSRIASSVTGGDRVIAASLEDDKYYSETLSVPVIGWSADEIEKMLKDEYWMLENAKYVESNPDEFEHLRGCFKPMTTNPNLPDQCKGDVMKTETAFRYRLYQLDGGNDGEGEYSDGVLGAQLNAQEVTEDGGSGTGVGATLNGVQCPSNMEPADGHPGYFKIPEAPNGEYVFNGGTPDKARYGSQQLVCVVYSVALAFHEATGDTTIVGDLNSSGHKSHNKGTAIDIRAATNPDNGTPRGDSIADTTRQVFNHEKTVAFGKLFVDTGVHRQLFWNHDASRNEIVNYANSKGTPFELAKSLNGHDNHFHVDLSHEFDLPFWEP